MRSNVSGGGFYNSEPRNYGRGFGRGNPRPYQSSQPPPSPQPSRKGDLFVEAGKLAVEYLVSNGLLSSDVLSGKTQNGSSQERELPSSLDIRSVATARPRATSPDGVSTSRRSPNDQDKSFGKTYSRERRTYGSSRSNSFDGSRENGRLGSLAEKTSPSQATKAGYDKTPEDSSKEEVSDEHVSRSTELVAKDDKHSDEKHDTEMCNPLVDSDSKVAFSHQDKDDEELSKPTDKVKETKDGACNDDKEEENKRDESPIMYSGNSIISSTKENTSVGKVHSFLTDNSPMCDPPLISEEKISDVSGKGDVMSGFPSTNEIPSSNYPGNALSDHSFSCAEALSRVGAINQRESVEPLSFTDKGFSLEHESIGLPGSEMCSSVAKDRGEKRALEEECAIEGAKKPRQWLSVAQSDEYLQLSCLRDKKPISVGKRVDGVFNEPADQNCFPNVSLPLKGGVHSGINHGEEKQSFSSSYKICDLNLMEGSDMHESHGASALLYPSLAAPKKELRIDVDLSMNDNCRFTSEFDGTGFARKDVEIIDLESPTMAEGKTSEFSTKNAESGIASVENISDNPQHPNDNPDGSDGYGLMISELLGNEAPNCSTVQPDINSLHNDMGLHHGEGMFSEDDPIYMSLGEIPLTGLLRAWEPPTQERNPFEL
ncbi:hypothetical protein RND81_09G059100 [Saponaria officinalis]|uniref:Uncharacterized protein n=1 Tax=Saponaria officinalis TaxID=3572 RepID=A0AAW1IIU3_SAPOF